MNKKQTEQQKEMNVQYSKLAELTVECNKLIESIFHLNKDMSRNAQLKGMMTSICQGIEAVTFVGSIEVHQAAMNVLAKFKPVLVQLLKSEQDKQKSPQ